MGIQQFPEPVDDSVWPMQFSGPIVPLDTGNSPGVISTGAAVTIGGQQNFTVPNFGRPLVGCLFSSTVSVHITGNAAGYFYLYVDGTERSYQRWHTQGAEWQGPFVHPDVILGLSPGVHTMELKATAEVAGPSLTYARTYVTFFG